MVDSSAWGGGHVCVEKLNVRALFEAIERGEKLNHACANVNWLCTVQ